MNKNLALPKRLLLLGSVTFVLFAFLIAIQSYFHNKEVHNLSSKCYDRGGSPSVKMTPLLLGYSFTCKK
jgi:hypothetical protein